MAQATKNPLNRICTLDYKSLLDFTCLTMNFHNHDHASQQCTLESGIVVPVGIFVKINKRTGWNKRTGGIYYQIKSTKSKIYFKSLLKS